MKLTTETIKSMVDMYPPYMSAEQIFVNMVGRIAINYPQVLPELATTIGAVFNTQFETQAQAFHLINERASYLESYLSGKMFCNKALPIFSIYFLNSFFSESSNS